MRKLADVPYVSDREAFLIARILEPAHPDIARRIRRAAWKRRAIAGLSIVVASAGFWFVLYGLALYAIRHKGVW